MLPRLGPATPRDSQARPARFDTFRHLCGHKINALRNESPGAPTRPFDTFRPPHPTESARCEARSAPTRARTGTGAEPATPIESTECETNLHPPPGSRPQRPLPLRLPPCLGRRCRLTGRPMIATGCETKRRACETKPRPYRQKGGEPVPDSGNLLDGWAGTALCASVPWGS